MMNENLNVMRPALSYEQIKERGLAVDTMELEDIISLIVMMGERSPGNFVADEVVYKDALFDLFGNDENAPLHAFQHHVRECGIGAGLGDYIRPIMKAFKSAWQRKYGIEVRVCVELKHFGVIVTEPKKHYMDKVYADKELCDNVNTALYGSNLDDRRNAVAKLVRELGGYKYVAAKRDEAYALAWKQKYGTDITED